MKLILSICLLFISIGINAQDAYAIFSVNVDKETLVETTGMIIIEDGRKVTINTCETSVVIILNIYDYKEDKTSEGYDYIIWSSTVMFEGAVVPSTFSIVYYTDYMKFTLYAEDTFISYNAKTL